MCNYIYIYIFFITVHVTAIFDFSCLFQNKVLCNINIDGLQTSLNERNAKVFQAGRAFSVFLHR